MHKRFIVLEARQHVSVALDYFIFLKENNPNASFAFPTKAMGMRYVKVLAEELLAARSLIPTNGYDWTLAKAAILFNCEQEQVQPHQIDIAEIVDREPSIDGIVHELSGQIYRHIEEKTWTEWKIISMAGILAMAEGKDYRVSEWEQANEYVDENERPYISLNCSNPIEYIHEKFETHYGMEFTAGFITALVAEVFVELYPQLRFSKHTPMVDSKLLARMGIFHYDTFKSNVVSKVLHAFGLTYFSTYIKRNKSYEADLINGLLTIREVNRSASEREILELVESYERGDRLLPGEVDIAERWIMENRQ
jgi:hypothetical protein